MTGATNKNDKLAETLISVGVNFSMFADSVRKSGIVFDKETNAWWYRLNKSMDKLYEEYL